ncbi:unnamed protein product [Adineta ricciae]|uniref:glutathione transferase n=1 Tax=Adineta ricciae TaxID=249248 RepID=A0A813RIW2_ADIRI|nr:unnamed protein product [Adineta ricciae]
MSASSNDKNQLVLGYWAIRGLVEPIRLALHYAKVPFTDKTYEQGEGPEFSREQWLSEKEKLGLDFPNLPYLIDGDLKMTQSKAILYYLGRKFNLLGKTPAEEAYVMMLCEEVFDVKIQISDFVYSPKGESKDERKQFVEKTFADQPTVADFQLFDFLDSGFAVDDENTLIEKFPNTKQFLNTIRELPELSDYIAKAQAKFPINNKVAKFGGKVLERK